MLIKHLARSILGSLGATRFSHRNMVNIDAQNPSKLSPWSSKPELQTVVGNLSQILPKRPGKFHVAGLGEPGASAVVSSTTCALAKQLSSLRMHH